MQPLRPPSAVPIGAQRNACSKSRPFQIMLKSSVQPQKPGYSAGFLSFVSCRCHPRLLKAKSFSRQLCARVLLHSPPKKAEGAERRKARTVETALARRGAHLAIGAQRLPALHCGARQAVTPDSTPGRVSWNRRVRTGGPSPAPVQRAPRGPVVVPDERGPEAARERTANPRAGTAFAPYSGLPREHALNERSDVVCNCSRD